MGVPTMKSCQSCIYYNRAGNQPPCKRCFAFSHYQRRRVGLVLFLLLLFFSSAAAGIGILIHKALGGEAIFSSTPNHFLEMPESKPAPEC